MKPPAVQNVNEMKGSSGGRAGKLAQKRKFHFVQA
jgi:hypothetical protein